MGIGGDPAIGVADQEQVAEAFQLISRIGDGTAVGGVDFGALLGGDVDAVIMLAAILGAEAGDDLAL